MSSGPRSSNGPKNVRILYRRHGMLHILPAFFHVILELPAHRLKRVTHGDVRIFMRMPFGMLMLRDEMGTRGRDLDANLVDTPLMAVFVWKRNHHLAMNDVSAELGQALRQLPDACAQNRRRLDISPSDPD